MDENLIEYAVYKGEELLVIGTVEECAEDLNLTKGYIQWLATPSGRKRFESRKKPEKCITAIRID